MIPKAYITEWTQFAPWKSNEQVEQDLIISRILVEIFSDGFLKENLAFRGGTALHKLHLKPAKRYSEDIDLVQIKPGPIKPILKRIGEKINFFEQKRNTQVKGHGAKAFYRFISEYEEIKLRIKLEINCKEHFNLLDWVEFPFEINNTWFSGKTLIKTYSLNEMLGTKLRALYQRSKGRDLFDLYYASQICKLDYELIIRCFKEYITFSTNKRPPTKKEFLLNIAEKENNPEFIGDIEGLLRPNIKYSQHKAFNWLKTEIVERM